MTQRHTLQALHSGFVNCTEDEFKNNLYKGIALLSKE